MESRLDRHGAAVLAAGFMVLLVGGGSRFAIGLTLKPMTLDLGWSRSTFGLAVAAFMVVSAVAMFLSGRLADRFSPRGVLAAGLVLSAIGIGCMGLISAPWHAFVLYGGVFALGAGVASLTPVGVIVSRWFPTRTGLANAVATSGIGVGQLLMIGALAATLAGIGWREAYLWLGLANLVLVPFVLVAIARRDSRSAPAGDAGADVDLHGAVRTRHFWLLATVYAICGFQDFFVSTHVVAFAQDQGVDDLLAGNLLALMGLTGVVGVIAAGAWSDASGPALPTLACFVLRLAVFALVFASQTLPAIAAFALLYGATFWATAPLTVVFARQAFGRTHLGALSGLVVMIHHMAGGLGAYLGAAAFDTQGHYRTAFAVMLILSLVAIGFTAVLRRR